MNGLDERLMMLFHHVPQCECVADIGTDHGYLPIALVSKRKCNKAIACDISAPSLKKAETHSRLQGIPLDCRISNGLSALEQEEADCIVIAGMGGILISEILTQGKEKINDATLVLQPMTAVKELREYLCNYGFSILKEDMVFQEEKLYHVLVAKKGEENQEYDCEIGSGLKNHPLYGKYLMKRKDKELEILKQMGSFRGEKYQKHKKLLEKLEQEEAT
ncbi:MAG: SAM-dependent methyltransferase [Ruminococcaceae bacterium]|nr:SAM-dependent methyltransferase [Oscillospiraceae bacterium]